MQRGMSICCNLVNIKSYQLRKLVTIAIPQYSYSTKYPSFNYVFSLSRSLLLSQVYWRNRTSHSLKSLSTTKHLALSVALCPVQGPCATYDTTQILLFVSVPKRWPTLIHHRIITRQRVLLRAVVSLWIKDSCSSSIACIKVALDKDLL